MRRARASAMGKPRVIVVMGVSGSGKSTVGMLLADRNGGSFHDGDNYHPEANVRKMAAGTPLNDDDSASASPRVP